eukprot:3939713-Rhodomonas_salina.1
MCVQVLAKYLEVHPADWNGKRVLDLGSHLCASFWARADHPPLSLRLRELAGKARVSVKEGGEHRLTRVGVHAGSGCGLTAICLGVLGAKVRGGGGRK